MEKWANKKNKKSLMKWRLYKLHNKAISPHLGANVFSFLKKKKFHDIVSFFYDRPQTEWPLMIKIN